MGANVPEGVRGEILKRDRYKCQCCRWKSKKQREKEYGRGFLARRWLEVHHKSGDRADNRRRNLVTLCVECHQFIHFAARCWNLGRPACVILTRGRTGSLRFETKVPTRKGVVLDAFDEREEGGPRHLVHYQHSWPLPDKLPMLVRFIRRLVR